MKTSHWESVSQQTRSKAGGVCAICGDTGQGNAHHVSYARLGAEIPGYDTKWLCQKCHMKLHQLIDESDLSVFEELDADAEAIQRPVSLERMVATERIVLRIGRKMNIMPQKKVAAYNIIRNTLYQMSHGITSTEGNLAACGDRIMNGKKKYDGVDTPEQLQARIDGWREDARAVAEGVLEKYGKNKS